MEPAATTTRRYTPGEFPPGIGSRLRAALAHEHAREPFGPADVRAAAHRVVALATSLSLDAVVIRGGLDVGGAELDHLWADVEGRVVDVSLPVCSEAFLEDLRAYVAGDLADDELDRRAHGYRLGDRVVGRFPVRLGYLGAPVWHSGRR